MEEVGEKRVLESRIGPKFRGNYEVRWPGKEPSQIPSKPPIEGSYTIMSKNPMQWPNNPSDILGLKTFKLFNKKAEAIKLSPIRPPEKPESEMGVKEL